MEAPAETLPEDASPAPLSFDASDEELSAAIAALESRDVARVVCELTPAKQAELVQRLPLQQAIRVLKDLPGVAALDAIAALPADYAATIVGALPSDLQADVVGNLPAADAAAILAELAEDEAERIAELASYPDDTAGGLMATEVIALRDIATVATTLRRLRAGASRLRKLDVQYAYVVCKGRQLVGVLRLRDLLVADEASRLAQIMIADPVSIHASTPLPELLGFFDDHRFLGVPVVDDGGRLLGTVSREAANSAAERRATSDYRRSMGVVREELRSMPTLRRSRQRLAWLGVNIALNVIAASVIAAYQETLAKVIALAVFLPILSDISGCSGAQAVAVSMREMSLGLLRPTEWLRVWAKEASVGLINGLALGAGLGVVGWFYTGNGWFGAVLGVALAANTVVSVLVGGVLPLALKRAGVDPALASGPILSTVTDMSGFLAALSLAATLIERLV